MQKTLSILWVISSWDKLDHKRDTTLRLIESASAMARCYLAEARDLSVIEGVATIDTREVLSASALTAGDWRGMSQRDEFRAADFSLIVYRDDPPFDLSYRRRLQMLSLVDVGPHAPRIVNSLKVLMTCTTKLNASHFGLPTLPTVVTSAWAIAERFARQHSRVFVKPVDSGDAAEVVSARPAESRSFHALLERATRGFTEPVVVQAAASPLLGETRSWFLRGRCLGSMRKVSRAHGWERAALHSAELATVSSISTALANAGVCLAAVDMLGPLVIDVNVGSPGRLRELESCLGEDVAGQITQALIGDVS